MVANVDSAGFSVWLTEGLSHTCLKSICSSTGQHFVDSENVPWVRSDSEVEIILGHFSQEVFVDGNSASLKSLWGNLLSFVWDQVDADWELAPCAFLVSSLIESEFWIWTRSVVSGFWIGLSLYVSVASGWSSSHCFIKFNFLFNFYIRIL